MNSTVSILKTIPFSQLSLWDVKRYKIYDFYLDKFPRIKLENVLNKYGKEINLKDNEEYKQVTIKLYGKGVILRGIKKGSQIKTKRQFLIKGGQFIYSKIDARNGAFGIVPEELDGAVITNSFSVFNINTHLINPTYLFLVTSSKNFRKICERFSSGTTGRRNISDEILLNLEIPLPPLEEQNRLVAQYNATIQQANEQEKKARELEQEIENYLFEVLGIEKTEEKKKTKGLQLVRFKDIDVWGVDKLAYGNTKQILMSIKYDNYKLKDILYINPKTDFSKYNDNFEMSFIPMKYISDEYGEIINMEIGNKGKSKGYTKFKEGDLLWSRITPCMQNGKSAIAKNLINKVGYGSTEYHIIRQKEDKVLIEYVYYLLRTNAVRQDAMNYFTGSAGQQRVPKSYLENLLIPLPPLSIQKEIARHISDLKQQIKDLRRQAEENRKQAIKEFEQNIFVL